MKVKSIILLAIIITPFFTYAACVGCESLWLRDGATHTIFQQPYFFRVNVSGNVTVNDSFCIYNATAGLSYCINNWSGVNVTLGDLNITINGSLGYHWNNTAAKYNGSIGGYVNADAACANEYNGTHLCSFEELIATVHDKLPLDANWTGYAWYNSGGSKYHVGQPADDCHGWSSDTSNYLGSFWIFNSTTGGYGAMVNCIEKKSLACCKIR